MPEQDAVAQWKAFSPEQRQTALAKMTPEQKQTLKTRIEQGQTPQKPNPVGNTGITMGAASGPMPASTKPHEQAPLRERVASKAGEALPMVGATVGAFAGGPVGAGVGAMAGTAAEQGIDKGSVSPKDVAVSGVENAALEYVGGKLAPKILGKIAAKAGPRVAEIVNNYLGLSKGQLPKFGRTVQNAQEIAQTVLDKVGIKPNLEAQKAAIETTRQAYDDATKKLVQAPGSKLADVHSALYDRAVKLLDQSEKEGVPAEKLNAIDKNLESLLKASKPGGMMNPGEMHAMRKEIQQQITDWNPQTLDIRQRFLQGAYHDLNDSIARSLPPKEAREFLANNRIQSKLITARNAADATIHKAADKSGPGLATRAARTAGRAAVGAAAGGLGGSEIGHGKEGAVLGAVAGAASGRVLEANLPRADVLTQKILGKTAAKLAKVSKATPQVVRTLNAIQAVQSRPQQ
jgi:hypothetical protein